MNEEYFFSIIIPIYNGQEYIHRCLESILNQTFTSYEVILVNDGSIDNSSELCLQYSVKYSNITLINKQNEGVSKARNVGIDSAKGKYIIFIDVDDTVSKDALQISYEKIIEKKVETILWNFATISNGKEHKTICLVDKVYNSGLMLLQNDERHFACWGWVFSKELLNTFSIRFKADLSMSEDRVFIHEYFEHCNKPILRLREILYYHYNEDKSVCNSKPNYKKAVDQLTAALYLEKIVTRENKKYINKTIQDCLFNFLYIISRIEKLSQVELLSIQNIIRNLLRRQWPLLLRKPSLFIPYISLEKYIRYKKWNQ